MREIHDELGELRKKNKNSSSVNNIQIDNININFQINVNSINNINIKHIDETQMFSLIADYDRDGSRINDLLANYMAKLLCDRKYPENHCVKYLRKNPPTFSSKIVDKLGNQMQYTGGLVSTYGVLTDPILNILRTQVRKCKNYVYNEEQDLDENGIYEDTFDNILTYLNNNENIKKALSMFLKDHILGNDNMKITN